MASKGIGEISSEVFEFKWKLRMDTPDIQSKTIGQGVSSPAFVTQHSSGRPITWCLALFPKGFRRAEDVVPVSIGLRNLSGFQVEASVEFYCYNTGNGLLKRWRPERGLFKEGDSKGPAITRANSQLTVGEIVVGCQIVVEGVLNPGRTFVRVNELDDFEKLLRVDDKFADLTVLPSDGKVLRVHKCVLASRSPVFKAMLENDTLERSQSVVNIQDIEHEVLMEMFRFIYCGRVDGIQRILFELLRAADKYCIEGLKLLCEESVMVTVNKRNALEYLRKADESCAESSARKILGYIADNAGSIVRTREYKNLGVTHPHLTHEITGAIVDRFESMMK